MECSSYAQYVARETQVRAEDIEILLMKNLSCNGLQSTLDTSNSMENKDVVQVLEGEDTLAVIRANCASNGNHLVRISSHITNIYFVWPCA